MPGVLSCEFCVHISCSAIHRCSAFCFIQNVEISDRVELNSSILLSLLISHGILQNMCNIILDIYKDNAHDLFDVGDNDNDKVYSQN